MFQFLRSVGSAPRYYLWDQDNSVLMCFDMFGGYLHSSFERNMDMIDSANMRKGIFRKVALHITVETTGEGITDEFDNRDDYEVVKQIAKLRRNLNNPPATGIQTFEVYAVRQ